MGAVITDPELLVNQLGDTGRRPDSADPAKVSGALGQQSRQLGELFGGEARLRAGRRLIAQGRRPPALGGPREPLADGPLSDAQGAGDGALFPALLMQDPGALAAAFAPTARWGSIGRFHAAILPYFHPILEAHAQLNR